MTSGTAWRALVVAGILFTAAGMIVRVLQSSQAESAQRTTTLEPNLRNAAKQSHGQEAKSFSRRIMSWWKSSDDIAWFTGWLAIFSGLLVVVSVFQFFILKRTDETAAIAANAATDSAKTQEMQLREQRAYVYIDLFEVNVLSAGVVVSPKWRNSGSTPTRHMTNWVNWKSFLEEPPPNYDFPDFDATGHPITNNDNKLPPSFVGPQATTFAESLTIPPAVFAEARDGKAIILVWGWAQYKDIFGMSHITKFCNRMQIELLGSGGDNKTNAISFPTYSRHNCTDEECLKQ